MSLTFTGANAPAVCYSPAEPAVLQFMASVSAVGDLGTGWRRIIDELLEIRTLRDDWDGTGAEAPPIEIVDFALKLAEVLQAKGEIPPSRATATPSGTVILEWQQSGLYRELEIIGPSRLEWMSVDHDGRARHGSWVIEEPTSAWFTV